MGGKHEEIRSRRALRGRSGCSGDGRSGVDQIAEQSGICKGGGDGVCLSPTTGEYVAEMIRRGRGDLSVDDVLPASAVAV